MTSNEPAPLLCDDVNPFNDKHHCTLGLGHPTEVAHTDGDATWLHDAARLKAWLESNS